MSIPLARLIRSPALWIALLAALLALAWLGGRGIWDPDEGRYTNVALNMLDSGDWLNPHRNHEVGHWTKPPLTYWAIASSIGMAGHTAFAARLPSALAYLLVTWLAWRTARRLVPGAETMAALAYATMLLPFASSQLITTDPLLAACQALAMHAFVEARFGDPAHPRRWIALMWAGFGLAFLTKGPPALLPLLAVVGFDLLGTRPRGHRLFDAVGMLVFVLLAAPWYAAVIHGNPGLLQYFIGDEVYNRIATNEFGRHGEWYGWLKVYLPTLLLGSLPWTPALIRWAIGLPTSVRAWRDRDTRHAERAQLLLALWVLLPLLVFCIARSRLPLYLLPLFLPLSLLVARQRQLTGRGLPHPGWIVGWALLLLALKLAAAQMATPKDAAAWAREIRARVAGPIYEVNSIDDLPRYGLHLELGAEVERVSLQPLAEPRINPDYDEDLARELAEREPDVVWLTRVERFGEARTRIEALGYRVEVLGAPYSGRMIFRILPPAR
jgi:4-amino-4-deoxy-L-arabinose transferase-like glycosyltransferase